MKRNFDFAFKNMDGSDLKEGENAFTLKVIAVNALLAAADADRNLSGDEKLKRYLLATKVNAGGDVDVTAEEILVLKTVIGRMYPPLIVGQAFLHLEKDQA